VPEMMRYIWFAIIVACPGILLQLGQSVAAVLLAVVFGIIEITLSPGSKKQE
jgi:hypothetical protein